MKRLNYVLLSVSLTLIVLSCLVLASTASAHHEKTIPTKISTIERIYPDLHARVLRERPVSWQRLRVMAADRWQRTHPAADRVHQARLARASFDRLVANPSPANNREVGRILAAARGWDGYEFDALDELWGGRESGWAHWALNPTSGACHIPQALPCSKIPGGLSATNATAITWGLDYIRGRYGSPSAALGHHNANGWY